MYVRSMHIPVERFKFDNRHFFFEGDINLHVPSTRTSNRTTHHAPQFTPNRCTERLRTRRKEKGGGKVRVKVRVRVRV
jgi:hypothetical protein